MEEEKLIGPMLSLPCLSPDTARNNSVRYVSRVDLRSLAFELLQDGDEGRLGYRVDSTPFHVIMTSEHHQFHFEAYKEF